MDVDLTEAFTLCFNERHRCGGHLWEVYYRYNRHCAI